MDLEVPFMGVHDGHRARMKTRFVRNGLDNFDDHSVLELLLFYAVPRRDVNELAHALLDHFGTLDAVFEASCEDMMRVPGVGENVATLLTLIPQVGRRYQMAKRRQQTILRSSEDAGNYLVPLYLYERTEVVYLLCLDAKCGLISCKEVGRGVVNAAEVSVRAIVETALSQKAVSVILSHNHVDAYALPSREDELTTRRIRDALLLVGITLADHIIVCGGLYVVCRQRPALNHHQRHKSCILPVKLFFKSLAAARDLCYGNKIGFCEIHKVRFHRFLIYAESEQTLEIEKKIRC